MEATKILIALAIGSSCSWGCGCVDQGTAGQLDQQAQQNYIGGDAKMLNQIKQIGAALQDAYQKFENQSAHSIETSLRLKNAMTIMEKEILFNEKAITGLQSVMSDVISLGAETKAIE